MKSKFPRKKSGGTQSGGRQSGGRQSGRTETEQTVTKEAVTVSRYIATLHYDSWHVFQVCLLYLYLCPRVRKAPRLSQVCRTVSRYGSIVFRAVCVRCSCVLATVSSTSVVFGLAEVHDSKSFYIGSTVYLSLSAVANAHSLNFI